MISNPIIHKEVLSALRTRKAIAMQGGFLLAIAALLWLLWPAGGLQDVAGQQARSIFTVLAIGELVLVALFAPAFTSASITLEKERNTWESLFASPMKPWEIAVGKMVGSLTFLMLVTLTGATALAAPLLLGGVDLTEVLAAGGMLLITAAYMGLIGLLVSIIAHRSYRSVIITYCILLAVLFLVAIPIWPISKNLITRTGPGVQKMLHLLASLSPLQAMLSLVMPDSAYTTGAAGMPPFWQTYLVVGILAILAIAGICLYKLHRPIAPPRPREQLRIVERGQLSARSVLFLIDPRKRKRDIRWWQNPVLIKEFRTRPMLQTHWLMRAVLSALVASILLMVVVIFGVGEYVSESLSTPLLAATVVAILMAALVILVGPAMTSGAICADRESGVWDLLRVTRMSSWRIVSGKFQASIIPLLLLTGATVPALLIVLAFQMSLLDNVLRVLAVVGVTVAFVATCGMLFSSFASKTSTATAWTYAVVLSIGLGSLLVMMGGELFSSRFIEAIFRFNPIAAAMHAAGYPGMQKYHLFVPFLQIMGTATGVLVIITILRVLRLRRASR